MDKTSIRYLMTEMTQEEFESMCEGHERKKYEFNRIKRCATPLPELTPDFQTITKQMRLNVDILKKEITEHVDKELERYNKKMKELYDFIVQLEERK